MKKLISALAFLFIAGAATRKPARCQGSRQGHVRNRQAGERKTSSRRPPASLKAPCTRQGQGPQAKASTLQEVGGCGQGSGEVTRFESSVARRLQRQRAPRGPLSWVERSISSDDATTARQEADCAQPASSSA